MKVAIYPKKGTIEMAEREIPEIGFGEALVEVRYAGICGSDVHVWQGHHPTATYPRIPGHEFSGVLIKAEGELRSGVRIGDHVVVQPYSSCGICEPCFTGKDNVCRKLSILGIHQDGCFAQYVRVPLNKIYKLPDSVPLKMGALTEPLAVAVHDVRTSGLKMGQKALVIGGGPIGMLIALVAQYAGAEVAISEINDFRLDFARSLGVRTINPALEDLQKRTEEITNKNGFDVVFEVSGSRAGAACMTQTVKTGGTIMIVGMVSEPYPVDTGAVFAKELTMKGVRIHSQENFEGAVNILASGALNAKLEKLVTRMFTLDECVEAMEYQGNDQEHFKVLLEI